MTEPTTHILYIILYTEIILSFLLVLPFFNRTKTALVRWAASGSWLEKSYPFLFLILGLMLLSFIGSHRSMANQLRLYHATLGTQVADFHLKRALESEVNRNLGAACLMLTLFLNRYFTLLKNWNLLDLKHTILEQQARANSSLHLNLLSEKEKLENKAKTLESSLSPTSSEAVKEFLAKEEAWKAKTKELKAALKEAKSQLDKVAKEKEDAISKVESAEKQVDAIKKQASGTADEYHRVRKENDALKTKNEDLTILLAGGKDKRE